MRPFAISTAVVAMALLAIGEENSSKNEGIPNIVVDIAHPEMTPAPGIPLELRGWIEPRVTLGPDFVGFFSWLGVWATLTCSSGGTFAADSTWGACCPTTGNCVLPTGCQGNTVVAVNGGSGVCPTGHFCDTLTIINSPAVNLPMSDVRSVVQCIGSSGFYDFPRSFYRVEFPLTSPLSTLVETVTVSVGTATVTQTVEETVTLSAVTVTVTRIQEETITVTGAGIAGNPATVTVTIKPTIGANATPASLSRAGDLAMLLACLVPLLASLFGLVFIA